VYYCNNQTLVGVSLANLVNQKIAKLSSTNLLYEVICQTSFVAYGKYPLFVHSNQLYYISLPTFFSRLNVSLAEPATLIGNEDVARLVSS